MDSRREARIVGWSLAVIYLLCAALRMVAGA
jgi:hypothetical protein